jgi:hypothetical protein
MNPQLGKDKKSQVLLLNIKTPRTLVCSDSIHISIPVVLWSHHSNFQL